LSKELCLTEFLCMFSMNQTRAFDFLTIKKIVAKPIKCLSLILREHCFQ